jgi:hypothetical protein
MALQMKFLVHIHSLTKAKRVNFKHFHISAKNYQPVPNAVRKKRANFKLRKMITPKAPVMVLNEMVGPVTYNFVTAPPGVSNIPPGMFVSQCEVITKLARFNKKWKNHVIGLVLGLG